MHSRLIPTLISCLLFACSPVHENPTGNEKLGDVVQPSFESLNEKVFTPKCLSCHNSPASPDGVDVSSYEKIMNNNLFPPLIVAGKPKESSLYTSCENKSMPQGGPPLSEVELKAFHDWILAGAKAPGDDGSSQCPVDNPNCNQPAECEADEPCDTQCETDEPCP